MCGSLLTLSDHQFQEASCHIVRVRKQPVEAHVVRNTNPADSHTGELEVDPPAPADILINSLMRDTKTIGAWLHCS